MAKNHIIRFENLNNLVETLFCKDNMVSFIWTTLCFGQPSSYWSIQPNCSHRIYERGNTFLLHILNVTFVYIFNFWSFSWSGSSGCCEKQPFFNHFSWGNKIEKWTTSPFQKGISHTFVNFLTFLTFLYWRVTWSLLHIDHEFLD